MEHKQVDTTELQKMLTRATKSYKRKYSYQISSGPEREAHAARLSELIKPENVMEVLACFDQKHPLNRDEILLLIGGSEGLDQKEKKALARLLHWFTKDTYTWRRTKNSRAIYELFASVREIVNDANLSSGDEHFEPKVRNILVQFLQGVLRILKDLWFTQSDDASSHISVLAEKSKSDSTTGSAMHGCEISLDKLQELKEKYSKSEEKSEQKLPRVEWVKQELGDVLKIIEAPIRDRLISLQVAEKSGDRVFKTLGEENPIEHMIFSDYQPYLMDTNAFCKRLGPSGEGLAGVDLSGALRTLTTHISCIKLSDGLSLVYKTGKNTNEFSMFSDSSHVEQEKKPVQEEDLKLESDLCLLSTRLTEKCASVFLDSNTPEKWAVAPSTEGSRTIVFGAGSLLSNLLSEETLGQMGREQKFIIKALNTKPDEQKPDPAKKIMQSYLLLSLLRNLLLRSPQTADSSKEQYALAMQRLIYCISSELRSEFKAENGLKKHLNLNEIRDCLRPLYYASNKKIMKKEVSYSEEGFQSGSGDKEIVVIGKAVCQLFSIKDEGLECLKNAVYSFAKSESNDGSGFSML